MTANSERLRASRVPLRYLLVIWLLVLSAVAFLDRTNISIAGVQIGRDFGIDHVHLGWIFSAFLIGYSVFQVPGGIIADRIGPRRALALGVLWWGVFTALTAAVPRGMHGALGLLVLVRFALGAGEAIFYPATSQFVARWVPLQERGKANGLIFAGVGLGAGLTPPLVTAIIGAYGWRASFWFSAVVGILAGAVWYWGSRDTPEDHPRIQPEELTAIREGLANGNAPVPAEQHAPEHGERLAWKTILGSKEILAITASYFTFGYVAWIFFGWFFIYLAQVRGLNLKTSAVYSMFPFLGMTVGCLVGGWTSDWLVRRYRLWVGRCGLSAFSLAFTAVLLVLGARTYHAQTASLILACGAAVLYLSQSAYWSVTVDIAGEHAAVVSGVMNMGGQVGGAVTASLTPLIAAHLGWNASFAFAALLALLGGISWLAVNPERKLAMN